MMDPEIMMVVYLRLLGEVGRESSGPRQELDDCQRIEA